MHQRRHIKPIYKHDDRFREFVHDLSLPRVRDEQYRGTGYGPEVLVFTTPYPATLGSDIKLSVTGSTSTQIQIQYTPLTSAACLIFGLDLNGGGDILDLDTNYYTSANSDLYRTTAHGYPWPVMTNGNQRNLILGWHDFVRRIRPESGIRGRFRLHPRSIFKLCAMAAQTSGRL